MLKANLFRKSGEGWLLLFLHIRSVSKSYELLTNVSAISIQAKFVMI